MDAAGPASSGEAIHTSTFLGHPVGCAMALAQIGEIEKLRLSDRSAELGGFLVEELSVLASRIEHLQCAGRGIGLMAALELNLPDGRPATQPALAAIKSLLQRGYIFLPEGEHGNVISFTPPLTITGEDLTRAVEELADVLHPA
jgi:4-aminobutyrate aminotransferase-like enzyme